MAESNSICLIPECGKPAKNKGLCLAHYKRLLKYGDPLKGSTQRGAAQRFFDEVAINYEGSECLIWPYAKTTGYGVMKRGDRNVVVSRLLCEKAYGPPPTPEHDAAHSCGNGHLGCVTKSHLSWKTRAENIIDMIKHGTSRRGERSNLSKLTEKQVLEIRSLKGKKTQRSIADLYGVHVVHVSDIQRGKKWSWLS